LKQGQNFFKESLKREGNYVFIYNATLTEEGRIDQSGIYAGNTGRYFDDFSVRSVPEPATLLFIGLIGLAGARRKIQQ